MYKQSTLVLGLLLGSASAIQLKFSPESLVQDLEGENTHKLVTREPSNEPFRPPDVGSKEIRPDVWKVVHDNVDAVPLGRDHLDEAPEKNPHYVHDLA